MQHYYTVIKCRELDGGGFRAKVYHYDETGNKEIIDLNSFPFDTEGEAADAAIAWGEHHNVELTLE